MEWTLERLNGPKNFIVLDKSELSYPCGRHPSNKIICQNLVVSRRHCIFVRAADDVISVIDLGSANGVYVNRKQIQANVLVELHENDIIGIGTYEEYKDNQPMFLYHLHKGNLGSRNLKGFDDLLTQRSSSSFANVESLVSSKSKDARDVPPLKRGLQEEIQIVDSLILPSKVRKLRNNVEKSSDEDVEIIETILSGSAKELSEAKRTPVDEVEKIWSTLSSPKISEQETSVTVPVVPPVIEESRISLNRANRLTLNIKNEDEKRKRLKKVEMLNGETGIPMSAASNLLNGKEKDGERSNDHKCDPALPKQRETITVNPSLEKSTALTIENASATLSSPDNSHRTIRVSLDSSANSTRFTVDISKSNESLTGKEDTKTIHRLSESEIGTKPKIEKEKLLINLSAVEKSEKLSNGIKTQPVRQRSENLSEKRRREVDEKFSSESANDESRKANGTVNKMESNRFSFSSKDPVTALSLFKLKPVKQEPTTSFSVLDTVDLSDDDDDIFPTSQLFDSSVENNSLKMKDEFLSTKIENMFEDNKNFFTERDAVIDESEEIIVSSESEDEEDSWFHRLSGSQRIKEEPEISILQSPKIEFVDETFDKNGDFINAPRIAKPEVPKTQKRSPEADFQSTVKPVHLMTVSEIESEINEHNKENSSEDEEYDASIFTFPKKASTILNKERKSLDELIRSKKGVPKGPEIIEPLRLPPRRRLSLRDFFVPSDHEEFDSPSTSKPKIKIRGCSVVVPKLSLHLAVKQGKELQIEDKIKQKCEIEQKFRRIRNKCAQSVPLPLGKRRSPAISKKEKLEIISERKEKLKALATKQKSSLVEPSVKRITTKPKAKVSTKNRGDFLINEQVASTSKIDSQSAAKASTSKSKVTIESKSSKSSKTSKTELKNAEESSKSKNSKKITTAEKRPEKIESKNESTTKSSSLSAKHTKRIEKRSKSDNDLPATSSEKNTIKLSNEMSLNQKENQMPNSLSANMENKKKKKVTFRVDLNTIKVYEIDPMNSMKKCTGKDALIPREKMVAAQKVEKSQHPRLEEFLLHIFQWNPSWLEEQRHLKTDPPIIKEDSLVPLLTNYKSYEEYYQIFMPLLLLELWHGITKEFESIDQNYRRQTVFCSIVNNSMTYQPIPSTKILLTTMLLEVLASEDDIRRQIHPVYGDLVFLELCYRNDKGKQNFLKVFAYVTQLHRTPITPKTFFNRDLVKHTKNPSKVLTYTVLTRLLKVNLCVNRVLRLRCVTYLRANMRMVQALQSLPSSPLFNLVLNPNAEEYQLSEPNKQSFLVTKDKLNHKQLEAVFKSIEVIVQKKPKVCLIQGPPGTGKSEVIVNMVMQVLYGDNRYARKETSLRILLCAPSNAAIDEIVLRLLDRRAKLLSDRFKMVRVGLLRSMHPKVREISMEELAKREVKQTIASYQTCNQSISNVEEEKRFLEARINALQSELNSTTHQRNKSSAQSTRIKLSDMKMRYDLMNNCSQSMGNNIDPRDVSKLQRSAESKILSCADIIACTLSSCYTNMMESTFGGTRNNISVCIVDEATQSCEAETLIPLMLGVNTLVLVGDPAQLPATVISQKAKKLGLDQSLFSRAQRALESSQNNPVIMLDVQYRMDVRISYWPNKYFYGGKLKNGLVAVDGQSILPFHPYRVVNLDSFQNSDKFSNTQEAEFVANLIYSMIDHLDSKKVRQNISIGVITPYRNQQTIVQAKINERLSLIIKNLTIKVKTEVNTVDSFQGHERDIIIMSCVRSSGIGFLSDPQRLCVALTRAKHCLVLCGNFATFQRDTMWKALLVDAQSRKSYIEMRADAKPSEIVSKLIR